MANEKVNKVVLGNETLIDLTGDTVSANNLLAGATAHDNRGEQIQGAVSVPTDLDDLSDVNAGSPASGDVLFNDGTEWINKNITKIVTQAQYNALVQAGTVDPDVDYHISDGLSVQVPIDDNSISTEKVWSSKKVSESQAIYSTDEKVVGTWIDGKPIYRIVVTGNTGSISTWVTFVTLSSDCIIKIADAYLEDTSGGVIKAGYSKGGVFEQYLVGNVYQLYVGDNSMVNRPAYAIIQYTKTTD